MRPSAATRVPLDAASRLAVCLADLEEHQLAAVVELQAPPVPAHGLRPERARAPLVVEPGFAGRLCAFAVRADPAARRHARVADVVRRVARLGALGGQPPLAVEHEGFGRVELEVEHEALVPRAQGARTCRRCSVAATLQSSTATRKGSPRRARESRGSTAHALRRRVPLPRDVRDREVREVDLVRRQASGRPGAGREAAAEEGELEAEPALVRRRELAGVVPPLGLELEVRPVVLRQAELARRGRPRERRRLGRGELQRRLGLGEEQRPAPAAGPRQPSARFAVASTPAAEPRRRSAAAAAAPGRPPPGARPGR